ncbi:MAG: TetR/AcrR family transcriptional regulator [Armatimonadaceae bacterium]
MNKVSVREQERLLRENAVVDAALMLMARTGYSAMHMDAIAAEVGLSKAALYRLFPSKEALVAAALLRLMRRVEDFVREMPADLSAAEVLRRTLHWALCLRFTEGWPDVFLVKSDLEPYLHAHTEYMAQVASLSHLLGSLIERAKAEGSVDSTLPTTVLVHSLYGRVRDPQFDSLVRGGTYTPDEMADMLVRLHFGGIKPVR